jgi:hypothetical protein
MNAGNIPTIRVNVEGLKAGIVQCLGVHGSELGELLDKQVQEAVDKYPWQEEVDSIVHSAISEKVKAYFSYGKGGTAVAESVEQALDAVLNK